MTNISPEIAILPWVRVGAYALVTDEAGRILLCRTAPGFPAEGYWALPGGGVEHGEHPDGAVLRELEEETGLLGHSPQLATVWSALVPRPANGRGPMHWVAIVYRVMAEVRELRMEVGGSTDQCRWFNLEEVQQLPRAEMVDHALLSWKEGSADHGARLKT